MGTYDFNRSKDYPTTISIGPSYFDSYNTWPGFQYLHGFNLGKNGTIGYSTLVSTIPLMCNALNTTNLAYFTLGNEPDLYKTSAQGPVRPADWNESSYVAEYLAKTRLMRDTVKLNCPEILDEGLFQFYSPSFAGVSNSLNLIKTFEAGLDTDGEIAFVDSHNYMGGATQPGVTLQDTLMNHTAVVVNINRHLNESSLLADRDLPYLLGETNSLYNQGAPGLSNSFGAALWGVDFNLYAAATGIARVHMHQGTGYRYAAWQPMESVNETKGTKAPYYGSVAVAAVLGDLDGDREVRVANVDVAGEERSVRESAYVVYVDGRLERVAVLQMTEWNYTVGGDGGEGERPSERFVFELPEGWDGEVVVKRLMANGSDAITGVTFDGVSYNYELDEGKPVKMDNVTTGEVLMVGEDGTVELEVPWSSSAVLQLRWD